MSTNQLLEEALLAEYLRRRKLRKDAESYLGYVTHRAPWFVIEEWHVLLAEKFEALFNGEIDRLMVFAPPRGGKSQNTSEFLPEWWMGRRPQDQILHTSYAGTLVEKFGRRIRNVLAGLPVFHDMFPKCRLAKDSKSASRWNTSEGGEYNAAGVGAGIAGKGFHLGIIDDPISEQDAHSRTLRKNVNDWYGPGFYTRRMPERNAIVITMTRWAIDDLAGSLLANALSDPTADQWDVLRIPALVDKETAAELNRVALDPRYERYLRREGFDYPMHYVEGDSFSPRRWPKDALLRTKGNMTRRNWAALYQQQPVEEEGGIIRRTDWRMWPKAKPLPKFEYVLQCYDTAFEESETSDYSARTSWGVFRREEDGRYCALLLSCMKARLTFPDLLAQALEWYKVENPDRVLIEKRASGHSLLQEFRRRGVPVAPLAPKGKSKTVRAHAASILFEQGCVYYPEGKMWAEEVVDEVCSFPNGKSDDVADTVFYAVGYLRRTFHLNSPLDEEDDDDAVPPVAGFPVRSYAKVHNSHVLRSRQEPV